MRFPNNIEKQNIQNIIKICTSLLNHETSSDQFSFSYVEEFCWKETKILMLFMLMAPIPHPLSATTAGCVRLPHLSRRLSSLCVA